MDTMYIEVRKAEDLEYLRKAIKYVNIMKGDNCLHVDFYYNFDTKSHDQYDNIVEILTSAKSYKKLAVGVDSLKTTKFPPAFFSKLIKSMTEK